jgi:hypothetical protein
VTRIAETWRAKRRGNGAEMTRMEEGYERHVERAREFSRAYDRAIELEGVTFAPDEVVALLESCGYGRQAD